MTIHYISDDVCIVMFETIQEMPAKRYQKARQYEVMAAELGQNEAEQSAMLTKAENYALTGKKAEFKEEMHNYRLARLLTKDGFQASQLDWACHVHSVNGVEVTDYSEDNLMKLINDLSDAGLTQQFVVDTLADIKKKSDPNWHATFQSDLEHQPI